MKRLKVFISSKDTGGNPTKTAIVNSFPVKSQATGQALMLDTLYVGITGAIIRHTFLRIEFGLGGYDAAGIFHRNPDYAMDGALVIARDKNRAFWEANIAGKTPSDYWNNIPAWIIDQKVIENAASKFWGIDNLAVEIETV